MPYLLGLASGYGPIGENRKESSEGKTVSSMLTSLDGFIEGPSGDSGLLASEEDCTGISTTRCGGPRSR
ncbi:hypothetical protein X771_20840 [Mesorhizobium sp. LSJC277A00]|nr:hypothetical protein X771_20840 [Mesorhizobium sp. LSJC277A00]ESY12442.1 hypothetical protein X752_07460 [Mesorhizobium sp. LNJC398B00]ESY30959.1 hypothetical protein X748_25845 [Mesorhizobium sp. LNJC386A00]ESY46282.1 hypothetical protein X746_17660 [Mesorhizobium sp. LNJC380A00]